jgi:hypothetical protein
MRIRLKISKTSSGTYYIPSLSIKLLKKHSGSNKKTSWSLNEDGTELILASD